MSSLSRQVKGYVKRELLKHLLMLLNNIVECFGSVDGIINNASIIEPFIKVNDLSYEAIEPVINMNFYKRLYIQRFSYHTCLLALKLTL
jgi:NAD(P)-dependent dehydrogenase (short-subunit alcohol dehydrogenase family)